MDDCIIHPGPRQARGSGYGTLRVDGKNWLAHRYAYFLGHGPIPHGLLVCHRCNNKGCVNVDHLYLGTPSQNIRDAYRDGLIVTANSKKKNCPRCGSEYVLTRSGFRRCVPCKLANDRSRWAGRKSNWKRAVICRKVADAVRNGGANKSNSAEL